MVGQTRYRELKKLAISGQGKITYPGAGTGGTDIVVTGENPYLLSTKGWMNDSINYNWSGAKALDDVGCQMSAQTTFYNADSTGPYNVQGSGRIYAGTLHTTGFGPGSFTLGGTATFSSTDSLFAAGATAISRTIPTHPAAGLSVALGELRNEGIPLVPLKSLVQSRLRAEANLGNRTYKATDYLRDEGNPITARDLAGEYLGFEFGWKPIVSDLKKFARSIKNAHKLIDDLNRGSGQNVRRRYEFPATNTRTNYTGSDNYYSSPAMANGLGRLDAWMLGSGPTVYREYSETFNQRWFSGCYTYHLPPADNFFGKARLYETYANKILGTRLTPEVVWNLAPWSWAADWFANLGDTVTNVSAFGADGLAMRYGYVMEKNIASFTATWAGRVNLVNQPNTFISLSESVGNKTMVRRYASPYGFGLTFDGLSPRQKAITVALGISHGPRN
jgi:hypothetical protein